MSTWTANIAYHTLTVKANKAEAAGVVRAIKSLYNLNQAWIELTGVKGESEKQTELYSLFTAGEGKIKNQAKYTQDLDDFMNSLPETITTADIPGILARCKALHDEHIPVVDKRMTPAESDKKDREQAERMAEQANKEREFKADWISKYCDSDKLVTRPEGKTFVTISVYYNDSDSMSDYYHPHCGYGFDMVLGIVDSKKQLEAVARKVLAGYPELEKLSWTWHKEDYSMGHGYWLQSESIGQAEGVTTYGGYKNPAIWYEISFNSYEKNGLLPFKGYSMKDHATKAENKAVVAQTLENTTSSAGVKVEHEGSWTWITFDSKPDESVRESLKDKFHARFSGKRVAWYITSLVNESEILSTIGA